MELFKLVGKIFVDSDEAQKSISKTGEKAEGLGNKLAKGVGTAAKWAAGVAGAAAAVGGAMVAVARDTANATDEVDKGSQRMKISAEAYQELAYAANLSGVEISTLEKAAKKLEGTDINFEDAIEQIMSIGDESERTQAAIDMFGEAVAYQMTPLLNAGAEGLDAMRQEARDLGLVMSEDTVKAGAEMNDAFTKLQKSGESLKNQLGVAVMPIITQLVNLLLDHMPEIKKVFDELSPVLINLLSTIGTLLTPLLDLITPLISLVGKLIDPLSALLKTILVPIVSVISQIVEKIVPKVSESIDKMTEKILSFVDKVRNGFSSLKSGVSGAWSSIKNIFGFGSVDGSHASGLSFVPYDGYKAELHRGETILNSTDSSQLINKLEEIAERVGNRTQLPAKITVISQLDGKQVALNQYDYLNEIEMLRGATI